jgi:hypothetical protein
MITKAAYPNIKTLFAFIFVALKVASVSGSSMPWSMYKVVVSQDSKTYIEPRQASDDSAESLISLIDPESLLDRYNDSLPRNQKQVEFLLIKNENFAPFLSSAASSTAPVANSKKGKSGKKSSSAAPSSSSPQSDAIKNYLESLYEDFTAAHYMRHFSGFISNLSNRLYGTSPAGAAISCDSPLFERIKAFKISFIGSSQVKIFFYLQFSELEDPHYELRLKFSTQISSLFPTSCVSMLEQTDRNWSSIIELLKSKKPSASVVSASASVAVSAPVAAQSKSSKKKEKEKAKRAAAVVAQADELETSEAIAAALIAEQQEIEAQELQAKKAALEAENARKLKLKEEAEARALAKKQEKERLEEIKNEKRRIQSEKATQARLERDAAIQAENLRKQTEIREREAAKAAEKQERERQAAEQRELERQAAEQRELERQAAEQRELERQAALEASRLKEKRENELRAKNERKQKQEQDRKEKDRIKEERRLEQARMEQARLEQARMEQERLEQARLEQARIQQEKDISAHYEQLRLENEALKRQLEFSRSAPQSGSFGSNHGESPASSVSSLNNSPFYSSSHANPPPPGFAARQQYSPQATSGYLQYQGPLSYTSYAAPRVEPFSPQSYGQGHQTTPNSSGSFTYQSPPYPQSGILQVDPASRPRGSSILDTGSFHSTGSGSASLADSFPGLFASPRGRTSSSTSAPLSRVVGGPVRSPPAVESTPPPLFDFTGFLSGITEPTNDEIYQPPQPPQQPQQQYPPHQGGGSFW